MNFFSLHSYPDGFKRHAQSRPPSKLSASPPASLCTQILFCVHPHCCSMGHPRPEPQELETPQDGGMACAQVHIPSPPHSNACRVHHSRYVFIRSPVRSTTDQLVIRIGVAFFDTAWSRSVYPSSLYRDVSSNLKRHVNGFSSSSRYAPQSSWPHVPVREFTTAVAALMNNFPKWSIPSESTASTTRTAPCCLA